MIDVAVIGGGISGLTAAYELRRKGYDVKVLERQVRPGGNAISENINGFLMEHGPSTINAAVPEVHDLSGALGLSSSVVELSDQVKHRYLVKHGKLNGIPVDPLGFLRSDYLSPIGRLRLMVEAVIPKGKNDADETVDQYFARRFGSEFATGIMDPLVGGLYAGRSDELSVRSVFPKLVEMEQRYGSVCKAVLVRHLQGGVMPGRRLYSWSNGIATLPAALTSTLSENIHTGVTVRRIITCGSGFEVDTARDGRIHTRAIVIATQPHVAAALLEEVAPVGAGAIQEINAPPLAVAFLGYRRQAVDHPLDGLGYLAPSSEDRVLTGAQFSSSMFAGRAPDGYVSLTGYLGGTRHPEVGQMQEKDLIGVAEAEFKDLLGVRGRYEISRVRKWPRGLPQYCTGHQARIARILRSTKETPGLFVTGNYLSGPSVGACVANAQQTSQQVNSFLKAKARLEEQNPYFSAESFR